MKFEITENELKKLKEWHNNLLPKILEIQKEQWKNELNELYKQMFEYCTVGGTVPYYGTIGGGLTYIFTPTGVGNIIKVREFFTNEEIDITDYDSW